MATLRCSSVSGKKVLIGIQAPVHAGLGKGLAKTGAKKMPKQKIAKKTQKPGLAKKSPKQPANEVL